MKTVFLFIRRVCVLIVLVFLHFLFSGNSKHQEIIPKVVFEERRWTGTLTLDQKYTGKTGMSERHVTVTFNNTLPTLHRDKTGIDPGDPTAVDHFTDDKGTGSETYHDEAMIAGKKIGMTDASGSGQSQLNIVDINDQDYYIHAIGPVCNGTQTNLLDGTTNEAGPYTTDIVVSYPWPGAKSDFLSGSKTETTEMPGEMGTVTTTISWHLVRSTNDIPDPCTACGSVIGIENQSLGQAIAIAGTPFSLHYRSDRLPGGGAMDIGAWTFNVHHTLSGQRLEFGNGQHRTFGNNADAVKPVVMEIPGIVPAGGWLVAAEDGDEVYAFDRNGQHLRTVDALTGTLIYEFRYNEKNQLISIVDTYGQATTIERNESGIPVCILSPYKLRTDLVVDSKQNLASISNAAGEKNSFVYSATGLLTKMTDARRFTHIYQYNDAGRLLKNQDPNGGFTGIARTSVKNGHEVAVSTALGRTTKYSVVRQTDGVNKRVATFSDGSMNTLITGSDGRQKIELGDGTEVINTDKPDQRWGSQAPLPELITVKVPSGLVSNLKVARSVKLITPENPLSVAGLTETVDVNGRVFTSNYVAANRTTTKTSPLGRKVLTTLDATGHITEITTPGLASVHVTYDKHGRPTNVEQNTASETRRYTFAYDALGNLQNINDPLDRNNSFLYDAAGRITQAVSPDGHTTTFRHDALGNVTDVISSGRPAYHFEYDKVSQVSKYVSPDVDNGKNVRIYQYNIDQQVTRIIQPDGQAIDMTYSFAGCNCGKLSSLVTSSGKRTFSYHPKTGRLTGITSPSGITLTRKYDGMLLTGETWRGPVAGSVERRYNSDFKIISHSVNNGPVITYHYDRDGLLTHAGDMLLTRSAENSLIYGSTLGGISEKWTYNAFAEITRRHSDFNGIMLLDIEYTRDKLGRIISKTETIAGVTNNFSYNYDLAGRLVAVNQNGITTATYSYDGNGNLLSVTRNSGATTGTYDNQDRLLKYDNATYSYSPNGELLTWNAQDKTINYQYDALSNLLRVNLPAGTSIEYLVDGYDRRIAKKVNGHIVQGFIYQDDLHISAELDDNGKVVARFVYGTRDNVPDYMIKAGTKYRIISDHLGSPRLIVDVSNGVIAQRLDYDEFGNVLADSNPGFQPFGFGGGLYDRDTRLTKLGARDYDAITGRFTTKDPLGIGAGDLNLYRYAKNDPVNWVDPTGLDATIQCDGKGGYEVVLDEYAGHPAEACVAAHERQHIKDWKERYGEESCKGKKKGYLPKGPKDIAQDDYLDFRRKSECAAHTVGYGCAVGKSFTASQRDKPLIDEYIKTHKELKKNYCGR